MNATQIQRIIDTVKATGRSYQHGDDGDGETGPTCDIDAGYRLGPLSTDLAGNYLFNARTGIVYTRGGGALLPGQF
jgi:hypothetical protein